MPNAQRDTRCAVEKGEKAKRLSFYVTFIKSRTGHDNKKFIYKRGTNRDKAAKRSIIEKYIYIQRL